MEPSFRPSKRFLIRGGIATGIIALILIVQTDWFRALFHKAPLPPAVSTKTVGDFVAQDSNNNGYADWEEKLWGLDPTVLYTNGVANKTIIDERKKSLGIAEKETAPENETDALARELLTISAALGQSGEVSKDDLSAVGARLAESVTFDTYINHYSIKDVRAVQTTTTSLQSYYNAFGALAKKYDKGESEIDIMVHALESGDTSGVEKLAAAKAQYTAYAKELIALSVPVGIQKEHLEIVNGLYGISVSLGLIEELSENGANALTGVALYKINDARITASATSLHDYLLRYGILKE